MSSRPGLSVDPAAAAARALGLSSSPGVAEPEALAAAAAKHWAGLNDATRAAITALVELGGAAAAGVLEDEIGSDLESRGISPTAARKGAREGLQAAWESGLVARDRASRTFFLVPEIAAAFVPSVSEALLDRLPTTMPPQPTLDEHLACCAINVLRHEPLKLTREGTPFRRGLEALVEKLGALLPRAPSTDAAKAKDAEREVVARIDALTALLRDFGLLRLVRDQLEIDPEAVEAWAALGEPARAARLLPADPLAPPLRLLRLLAEHGPDRAWPRTVAERALRRSQASFADEEPSEAVRLGSSMDFAGALERLERSGLVAPDPKNPGCIALTALGRSFPLEADVPRPRGVHVGHDLAVLVPRGIPASVHARLGDVARLESADQVARYRLDRQVVLESLDRGATAGELELFLAEHATPVLPDAVRDDLRRWAERFGEVTSRAGICVSCSVARRHEEFEAVVRRSGLAIALVAPGVAVVAPEDHAQLCQLLMQAGLTPRRRIQSLPRGSASAVPRSAQPQASALAAGPTPDAVALDVAALPGWLTRFRDDAGRKAAPPPSLVASQVKEKYRREFGSGQLASLDKLDVDELIALEDKGLVRQFLAGKIPAPSTERKLTELDEYLGEELVAVTPARARQVLEHAARAAMPCQLAYLQGPGRTQKLVVQPIEIVSDGAGTYVRARLPGQAQERMLATDRIHAVRVVPPGSRG